jgi:hypothetical protein
MFTEQQEDIALGRKVKDGVLLALKLSVQNGRRLHVSQAANGHREGGETLRLGEIEDISGQRAPIREYGLAAVQNSIYL